MRWIRSFGGPLILLPRAAVRLWPGSYGPDGDDEVDEEDTEYWRVSEQVQDYAEAISVPGAEALVLANGGSSTGFVEADNLFVQEMAATRGEDPVRRARRHIPASAWNHVTTWNCAGPGLLFDSARYGPSVLESEGVAVGLRAGRYRVSCAYVDMNTLALTRLELLDGGAVQPGADGNRSSVRALRPG